MNNILEKADFLSKANYAKSLKFVDTYSRYSALCSAVMSEIAEKWEETSLKKTKQKRACYFSAEFLMGRAISNNLLALGKLDEVKKAWSEAGFDLSDWENEEDAALGNGGLGRLAACFLDSAATLNLPLDGYGIRYKYGLFKQSIENGYQQESPDDWTKLCDAWSIRRENEAVEVEFTHQKVRAVPYDMPIIGFGGQTINTLRLWQSEAINPVNLVEFNQQNYSKSIKEYDDAVRISQFLYPNDTLKAGKELRLKQEYFFTSASLQDILRNYQKTHKNFSELAENLAIQLNDTHPILAIPELIRLLTDYGETWENAVSIAKKVFSYTNHTVMAEAMECWNVNLLKNVAEKLYPIIKRLNEDLFAELKSKNIPKNLWKNYAIITNKTVNMAKLGCFVCHKINGVAQIHTEILKEKVLKEWADLYPNKIVNVTNGIAPRRWVALCNPQLAQIFTGKLGNNDWITNLPKLSKLANLVENSDLISEFITIKKQKKQELADFILKKENIKINSDWIFDVQVKRFHEYKRQTMNALAILLIYFRLKEGKLPKFEPMTVIFGGKAAAGYVRAKATIKLIHEIANLVNNDEKINKKLQIVFVNDYNVSYAEKIIPAADISEQISTAGTEASGTSNMKFMVNGAVTLGTLDGANIEIVEQAGLENNYIFGLTKNEAENLSETYNPLELYEQNDEIRRVVDALTDGTFKDENNLLSELKKSLLEKTYNNADNYFVLKDLLPYVETKLKANQDYTDLPNFAKKCWLNICNSGKFSSDRSIETYAQDIWNIKAL